MPGNTINCLFIGDIVGRPGRLFVRDNLLMLVKKYNADIIIANGENSAGGFGITPQVAEELLNYHIDIITSGNHIWDKKEIIDYIKDRNWLLRPANYPPAVPGVGSTIFRTKSGINVGVINLCGRVFMDNLDCPFRVGRDMAAVMKEKTKVIIVDMHAEATSEKIAIAFYLDGMVSAVVGTHTHVQTSDERILSNGTAFITDAGMTGSINSAIGIQKDMIIQKFLTQMPRKYEVATKDVELQGVVVSIDAETGKAKGIERIKVKG
ncbi:MAG: TIGR00282 family metallophosphoesterase [Deltaproteobacteria bacterium]|nr:TIGR00282 family metallophosphoesterase [Deltaproteobacteria bacterium]